MYFRPLERCVNAANALPRRVLLLVDTVGLWSRDTLVLACFDLVRVAGGSACLAAALVLDLVLFAGVASLDFAAFNLRCLRFRRLFTIG